MLKSSQRSACAMREWVRVQVWVDRSTSFASWLVVALLLSTAVPSACAALPALAIGQYRHMAFGAHEGAPTGVRDFAQTRDGMLWLVTDAGLVRFDGLSFEKVQTLGGRAIGPGRVLRIKSAAGGGLWIAFEGRRGIGRVRAGKFTEYPNPGSWGSVQSLVDGPDGSAWIVADHHLWTVRADAVAEIDPKWGYPTKVPTSSMTSDAKGAMWVVPGDGSNVYFLAPGEARFRRTEARIPSASLAASPNGELWFSGPGGLGLLSNAGGRPGTQLNLSKSPHGAMMFDRDGGAWVLTGAEVAHVPDPQDLLVPGAEEKLRADTSARVSGLSSQVIHSVFEDREGDVWLGTSQGVDRFHRPNFVSAGVPKSGEVAAVVADNDGAILATSGNHKLIRIDTLGYQELADSVPDLRSLYRDGKGLLWAAGPDLWRSSERGRFVRVPIDDSLGTAAIQAITTERNGDVWVGGDAGILRLVDGKWSNVAAMAVDSEKQQVTAMHTDAAGRVWIADLHGISVVQRGTFRRIVYGSAGLDIGTALTFCEHGPNLWIGGSEGVALFDGLKFRSLRDVQGWSYREITGIVQTAEGDLWVHGRAQVIRIDVDEMIRAMDQPRTAAVAERFKLMGSTTPGSPRPTLVQASDGRVWVSTEGGLEWIDPTNVARTARSPDVLMRSLLVDGVSFDTGGGTVIVPPLSKRFELFYGAVSTRFPLRLRFRYRLDGFDTTWQEVGERRSAFYDNLAPGKYHFSLMVANDDGLWGNGETDFAFVVPPAWFQTAWFRALCLLAGIALVVLGYRARTRQLTAKVALLFAVKQSERERIARELHDTLLQSTQGLIFAVQSAANKIAPGDPARQALEQALDRADEAMADGRSRIEDLRSPARVLAEFPGALVDLGEELAAGLGIEFELESSGSPRALNVAVNEEACYIFREAIRNAFQHADPSRVSFVVSWERDGLKVRLSDDGVGIQDGVLDAMDRPGHWGLAGMRERAVKLGAKLEVRRGAEGGTTVQLFIPASVGYQHAARRWLRMPRS